MSGQTATLDALLRMPLGAVDGTQLNRVTTTRLIAAGCVTVGDVTRLTELELCRMLAPLVGGDNKQAAAELLTLKVIALRTDLIHMGLNTRGANLSERELMKHCLTLL